MTLARRTVGVVLMAAAWLALSAAPGHAAELEDYLRKADEAGYSGRQVVITVWDGVSRAGVFDVEQAGDMRIINRGTQDALVRAGTVASPGSLGVAVPSWSQPAIADKYSVRDPVEVSRLGRAAESIDVYEGDRLRARLVFDKKTYAPLSTEVYTADGTLYRYSSLVDLGPAMRRLPGVIDQEVGEYTVMIPTDDVDLPVEVAGYLRADAYLGPDDSVQAFYSDGLFAFSIFLLDGAVEPFEGDDVESFEIDGDRFDRMLTPSEVWVFWARYDTHFILVGDLPPDHLQAVLADLPHPAKRNVFQRLWNGLFG